MRGNGIFHKITDDGPSIHPQQNNLPTKMNYQSMQANNVIPNSLKMANEKNEGLRSQLRRSYDANSGSLPHAHGI